MGNCCPRNAMGSPVNLNEPLLNPTLGVDYEQDKPLTEEHLKRVLSDIYFTQYKTQLSQKRKLQGQRAKSVKNGLNDDYINLVADTVKLEESIHKQSEDYVLSTLRVNHEAYKTAQGSFNMESIIELAMKEVLRAIRGVKHLESAKASDLVNKYQVVYDQSQFMLNSNPERAQKLSMLFTNDSYLTYTDMVVADRLYNDFKMLPLEIQAYLPE